MGSCQLVQRPRLYLQLWNSSKMSTAKEGYVYTYIWHIFLLCNLGIGQDIRSDRNTWWVTILNILDILHAHYFIYQCELPSLLHARIGSLLDRMIRKFAFSTTTRTKRWQALKVIPTTFVAWQFIQHNLLFYPDLMTWRFACGIGKRDGNVCR